MALKALKTILFASFLVAADAGRITVDYLDLSGDEVPEYMRETLVDDTPMDRQPAQKCCCQSSKGEDKCDGNYFGCLAFHTDKPKCCKFMAVCESSSMFSAKWRFPAAPNLCDGTLKVGGKEDPLAIKINTAAKGNATAPLQFLTQINSHTNGDPAKMQRDYTIIVDRSGSMGGREETNVPEKIASKVGLQEGRQMMSLWKEAEAALVFLAEAAVKEDPDGISLIFFDSEVISYENVKSKDQVMNYFKRLNPRSTTRTDLALAEAVEPDTVGRAETILVITDGNPNDQQAVEDVIVQAARQLCRDEDLAISFIQVGSSSGATRFLEYLDDNLQQKYKIYDIVDTMSSSSMKGKSFLDVIALGIED